MIALRVFGPLLRRLVGPLLVLMIALYAVMMPLGHPSERLAERTSGSAFSAETVEVSLRTRLRAAVDQASEVLKPKLEPAPILRRVLLATGWSEPLHLLPGFILSSPPATTRTRFTSISPRAPPAA
jgi:hypothetical protein